MLMLDILYSIVETAKMNNLVPFDYIHHILTVLSGNTDDDKLTQLSLHDGQKYTSHDHLANLKHNIRLYDHHHYSGW